MAGVAELAPGMPAGGGAWKAYGAVGSDETCEYGCICIDPGALEGVRPGSVGPSDCSPDSPIVAEKSERGTCM